MKIANIQTSRRSAPTSAQTQAAHERAILLAPAPTLVLPNSILEAPKETVCLANDAAYSEEQFSEPLTTYATGWKDPEDNQGLVAMLAPDVEVGRRFEFKQGINTEEFLTEVDDIRAIGSEFKRVLYTGTTALGKTLNKGLAYR